LSFFLRLLFLTTKDTLTASFRLTKLLTNYGTSTLFSGGVTARRDR
jgi:hypothetical protein